MMVKRVWYIVGALAAVALFLILFNQTNDPMTDRVRMIIETPQSYDGEHIDSLVALGSSAVPAVAEQLDNGDAFPLRLIFALERIEDDRGIDAILRFVEQRRPHVSNDDSYVTAATINVLKNFDDDRVSVQLLKVVQDNNAHPRVRLAAAGVVAAVGSGAEQEIARKYIMSAYQDRRRLLVNPNDGITEEELYVALGEVDTIESVEIMQDVLQNGSPSRIAISAIDSLSANPQLSSTEIIFSVAQDKGNYEVPVRVHAVEQILGSHGVGKAELISVIEDLSAEVVSDSWPNTYTDRLATAREILGSPSP